MQCVQIYPDMGVAAMLKNQWQDVAFTFASLSDRSPVSQDDDLIVLAAPDPQGTLHRSTQHLPCTLQHCVMDRVLWLQEMQSQLMLRSEQFIKPLNVS